MNRLAAFLFLLSLSMATIGSQKIVFAETPPTYRTADLTENIARLLKSDAEDAFFIIEIAGTPDFIQLYGSAGVAYLDFPMITERQQSLRPRIEQVGRDLGLMLTINKAANGLEFLDYGLPDSAAAISEVIQTLLMRIYSADETTPLALESNGFELTTP